MKLQGYLCLVLSVEAVCLEWYFNLEATMLKDIFFKDANIQNLVTIA